MQNTNRNVYLRQIIWRVGVLALAVSLVVALWEMAKNPAFVAGALYAIHSIIEIESFITSSGISLLALGGLALGYIGSRLVCIAELKALADSERLLECEARRAIELAKPKFEKSLACLSIFMVVAGALIALLKQLVGIEGNFFLSLQHLVLLWTIGALCVSGLGPKILLPFKPLIQAETEPRLNYGYPDGMSPNLQEMAELLMKVCISKAPEGLREALRNEADLTCK